MDDYPSYSIAQSQDQEWLRKQSNKEYRIAARREKRNRKADEKKQRKLNATILRRMTRNPDKYNKNADRNRMREIEWERRNIWQQAVKQAQRLAAVHDPSGLMFNVSPVVTLEDGSVITEEALKRRRERVAANAAREQDTAINGATQHVDKRPPEEAQQITSASAKRYEACGNSMDPDRLAQIEIERRLRVPGRSKSQVKKLARHEPRPPPPKPLIPNTISLFEDEENYLGLWDLDDSELERRIFREKKQKAAARKALRLRQQSGKDERRMARDEKRRVYRDLKQEWRDIKQATTREKTRLNALEDEESKKVAVRICETERQRAMACCAILGFTFENTKGVDDIKPRALGMKDNNVDFDAIEKGDFRLGKEQRASNKRVNLGDVPLQASDEYIPTARHSQEVNPGEFIAIDGGGGSGFETLSYNHKLRRKLRRAIEYAEIEKETLVRQRGLEWYGAESLDVPNILRTATKPVNEKKPRILENGTLETAKQERIRTRVSLVEFNDRMRVLRRQAKERAVFAGLQKHAEVSGKLPAEDAKPGQSLDLEFGDADKGGSPARAHESYVKTNHELLKTNQDSETSTENESESDYSLLGP
ncbi:uncharacterized protein KY384_009070 [Bacidia gigantensis]|uniref:uncharacterized protein n=1 Tax=Bacidia gigantensis TaxID=2732470 RepID=UPI001D05A5E1|nr:uncharacterized protein KY384_009070 [Bacidia gigantensis]KAG8525426.1 hypothetical protein KY384_009070 [Bacidia gigantensis]